MNAAQLLAEARQLAQTMQYQIREEYLDGAGGGHCFFAGRKVLLLDVTQSIDEQLSDVIDALRSEPDVHAASMSPRLAELLRPTRAA